jgi:hypothetical protein
MSFRILNRLTLLMLAVMAISGFKGWVSWSALIPAVIPPSWACKSIAKPIAKPITKPTIQMVLYPAKQPKATLTLLHSTQPMGLYVGDKLQTVSQLARQLNASAVINAGYFDPKNGLSTSYAWQGQQMVADPHENKALISNPALQPYLPAIFNRTELRAFNCPGEGQHFVFARRTSPVDYAPNPACSLAWAIGGGPQLLPELTAQAEAFIAFNTAGVKTRDPIGVNTPNARTAVALDGKGQLYWVLVSQAPQQPGLTLPELAMALQEQGMVSAMALDGGSSSSLALPGKTLWAKGYQKADAWVTVQRPVKSVLWLK